MEITHILNGKSMVVFCFVFLFFFNGVDTLEFDFFPLHNGKLLSKQQFCLDEASHSEHKPLQLVRSVCPD